MDILFITLFFFIIIGIVSIFAVVKFDKLMNIKELITKKDK